MLDVRKRQLWRAKCALVFVAILVICLNIADFYVAFICDTQDSKFHCRAHIIAGLHPSEYSTFSYQEKIYVWASFVLYLTYLLPVLGYIPAAIFALRRLRLINKEFYYYSRCKIIPIISVTILFLIWRMYWYYFMKFGEILPDGKFNADLVLLYTSEVFFIGGINVIQCSNHFEAREEEEEEFLDVDVNRFLDSQDSEFHNDDLMPDSKR